MRSALLAVLLAIAPSPALTGSAIAEEGGSEDLGKHASPDSAEWTSSSSSDDSASSESSGDSWNDSSGSESSSDWSSESGGGE